MSDLINAGDVLSAAAGHLAAKDMTIAALRNKLAAVQAWAIDDPGDSLHRSYAKMQVRVLLSADAVPDPREERIAHVHDNENLPCLECERDAAIREREEARRDAKAADDVAEFYERTAANAGAERNACRKVIEAIRQRAKCDVRNGAGSPGNTSAQAYAQGRADAGHYILSLLAAAPAVADEGNWGLKQAQKDREQLIQLNGDLSRHAVEAEKKIQRQAADLELANKAVESLTKGRDQLQAEARNLHQRMERQAAEIAQLHIEARDYTARIERLTEANKRFDLRYTEHVAVLNRKLAGAEAKIEAAVALLRTMIQISDIVKVIAILEGTTADLVQQGKEAIRRALDETAPEPKTSPELCACGHVAELARLASAQPQQGTTFVTAGVGCEPAPPEAEPEDATEAAAPTRDADLSKAIETWPEEWGKLTDRELGRHASERWIPVTEREQLPKFGHTCLVTVGNEIERAFLVDGLGWIDAEDGHVLKGVTAHHPLPAPYKAGGE